MLVGYIIIGLNLFIHREVLAGVPQGTGSDSDQDQLKEWRYEPRIWTNDDEENGQAEPWVADNLEIQDSRSQVDNDTRDPHEEHHYLDPQSLGPMDKFWQSETCSQLFADLKEAISCDKKRCDKFEFEWPKLDDQISIVQTTKHGMRFQKYDVAKSRPGSAVRDFDLFKDKPPKFDIFEFFKPKTTTTTTTTGAPSSAPSTSDPSTTSAPDPNTTELPTSPPEQEETTTPIPGGQETPATDPPANATRTVSFNTTQLVTTLRIDRNRTRQKIIGFGGALSDSTCRNIKSLSPQMSKALMEDYFGDTGLRYNLIRLTIGSSDFSTEPYTNNDKTNTSTKQQLSDGDDIELNEFKLVKEDYDFKLAVARQAIAVSKQEVKFFSSIWSPPTWMKNNSHIVHGFLKGDVFGPYYKAFAELLVKWLEAYRKNGIEMWGLTSLNEPITGSKPFINHNSLEMSKEDYITFYKLHMGPMLRQRGFNNTKLMALDDNKGFALSWIKQMLEDKEAAKYIDGIATHWYTHDEFENLDFISKYYPDKFILATEASNGFRPFQAKVLPGNWDRGVAYMLDILRMLQKNAAGWVDWNMVLDVMGGPSWARNNLDAAVIVNQAKDEYYKSPMFYAIGHFSRFIAPGSIRLDHRLSNSRYDYPLETVTFLTPDNYIVIVALNANRHPISLKIIMDRKLIRVVTLRPDSFSTVVFKSTYKKQRT